MGDIAMYGNPLEREHAQIFYRQALTRAEELGMRPLLPHCHRSLGSLYAAIGQRDRARAEISIAIELYSAMDMTFWLSKADVALAQVSSRALRIYGPLSSGERVARPSDDKGH